MVIIPLYVGWIGLKTLICTSKANVSVDHAGLAVENAAKLPSAVLVICRVRVGHRVRDDNNFAAFPTSESVFCHVLRLLNDSFFNAVGVASMIVQASKAGVLPAGA
jgi:hypothetical protein